MSNGIAPNEIVTGKRLLITGGTGSLGKVLIRRLLSGAHGRPEKVVVFSRDEAKQHQMRMDLRHLASATEEVIYRDHEQTIEFRLGDVRSAPSVASALQDIDIVFNAAALKQVPTCEYFPHQAMMTNIQGAENIAQSIENHRLPVETVVGISTDKACKPVNVMGMSKALQERIFIQANMRCPDTRFVCVRYGNVLASRGSVIPHFHDQIRNGGPVTITTAEMTRFLLPLEGAVDTIIEAYRAAAPGETYIPRIPSSLIVHVATALIGDREIEAKIIGIRPGEKIHEILVSEDEAYRTVDRGDYYAIKSILPELVEKRDESPALTKEYSSGDEVMSLDQTVALLEKHNLMIENTGAGNSAMGFQETLR